MNMDMSSLVSRQLLFSTRMAMLLVLLFSSSASAFVSPHRGQQHHTQQSSTKPIVIAAAVPRCTATSTTCRRVIPGVDMALIDAAIAVVSAAAGAASQLPRIQQLEKDVSAARSALTQVIK
jgi:predicted lipid-binding transport protein (Tim44 family)